MKNVVMHGVCMRVVLGCRWVVVHDADKTVHGNGKLSVGSSGGLDQLLCFLDF
jgi:hypothetical protein